MAMLSINRPGDQLAIETLKARLAEQCDAARRAGKAREAAANNGKPGSPNLKALAAIFTGEGHEHHESFQTWENTLTDLCDELEESYKGSEHMFANMAQTLRVLADYYEDAANSNADRYTSALTTFTDADRMSDADLRKLQSECIANFRFLLGAIDETENRQQDASAHGLIMEITGQPVNIRKRQDGVEFLLDIGPLVRQPRKGTTATSTDRGDSKSHMQLFVDGSYVPGKTLGLQCLDTFGFDAKELFARFADQAAKRSESGTDRSWKPGDKFIITHDGLDCEVWVEKVESPTD